MMPALRARPSRPPAGALALVTFLACGIPAARAEPAVPFETMIKDLGYEVTPATRDVSASFAADGYAVGYWLSNDETIGIISIGYAISAEQRGRLPARAMLLANNGLTSAFAVTGTAAGANFVQLTRTAPLAGLTAVGLRKEVDALLVNAKANDQLLNPENWK